jgi:hypothetical protein
MLERFDAETLNPPFKGERKAVIDPGLDAGYYLTESAPRNALYRRI